MSAHAKQNPPGHDNTEPRRLSTMPAPVVTPPVRPPDRDDEEVDLGKMIAIVLNNRWLVGIVMAVVGLGGSLYAVFATPEYRADALVQVEEKNQAFGGLKELTSMFSGETPAETEIEIIRSRSVVTSVIEEQNLLVEVQPRYFPLVGGFFARRYRGAEVAPAKLGLKSYGWGGERLRVGRLDVPAMYEGEELTLVAGDAGAYALLDSDGERILDGRVGEVAAANGVEMFVTDLKARPDTEFEVVRFNISDAVRRFQQNFDVREKGKQTGIIHISLEGPERERIIAGLDGIARAYLRQNVDRMSEEAEKTLQFVSDQLPALKLNLEAAEVRLNEYRAKRGSVDLRMETQAMVDKAVDLERQLTELALKRADLKLRFTEEHPAFVSLKRQAAQLETEKTALEAQLKNLPNAELNSVRLMRDVQVANELYLLLLNKAQELRVVKSGTIGNVRVLDQAALVQRRPVRPKKAVVILLSLFGGLALGVALAFARESMQRGLDDPDELEQRTGLPVYGSLPHSELQAAALRHRRKGKRDLTPLALAAPQDITIEAMRSLRTSLQFALADSPNNVVLIGGPRPAVGKSFVSVNLGVLLADTGKKVLLIDGDMRRGYLHLYLGLDRVPGLSDVLSGRLTTDEAIRPTMHENLKFMSTGTIPPNPSELLMGSRFVPTIEDLSKMFDLVLIDAPPVLAVTDAAIIGRHAGVNLLVLRAGVHPAREVTMAVTRLQQNGIRANGFIFNDVRARVGPSGYGAYGYHYHYKYS